MSMEEVSMREDEAMQLRAVISKIRTFASLAPLDLLKPGEIQRQLLAICDEAEDI